jgi:hypothetical protein
MHLYFCASLKSDLSSSNKYYEVNIKCWQLRTSNLLVNKIKFIPRKCDVFVIFRNTAGLKIESKFFLIADVYTGKRGARQLLACTVICIAYSAAVLKCLKYSNCYIHIVMVVSGCHNLFLKKLLFL